LRFDITNLNMEKVQDILINREYVK
jgi:hypothetical protein